MKPHRRQPDKEKSPSNSPECLPANLEFEGDSQADGLPSRIARYSRAKERALAMRDYLVTIGETKAFEAAGFFKPAEITCISATTTQLTRCAYMRRISANSI